MGELAPLTRLVSPREATYACCSWHEQPPEPVDVCATKLKWTTKREKRQQAHHAFATPGSLFNRNGMTTSSLATPPFALGVHIVFAEEPETLRTGLSIETQTPCQSCLLTTVSWAIARCLTGKTVRKMTMGRHQSW